MTKIWIAVFWEPPMEDRPGLSAAKRTRLTIPLLVPVAVLAALTVVIGIGAQPFMALAMAAAEEMLAPERYVQAVMGRLP
jgi:multicomponent Na+:H+ antiporter subunit D